MYYGADKITKVEDDIDEGYKRVQIEFAKPIENEDGSVDTHENFSIPEWELTCCTTDKPGDLTTLMVARSVHVVSKILLLFEELDVRTEDVQYFAARLLNSMTETRTDILLAVHKVTDLGDIRISDWGKALGK